ncbi:MAG TPA: ADOP family duplicated permease, partial [Thermoanaerobaculia bacterium]|nr:ADOP family duplicated permease [Thermoanaerobaculia bacterium]
TSWPLSQMDLQDWRERNQAFTQISVWGVRSFNLEQGPQSERLMAEVVNAEYFPLLGLEPELGRFFTPDEDKNPFEDYVLVLGYDLWRSSFGGDPQVIGRTVQLNTKTYEIIGVGPQGFRGLSDTADFWVPSMLPQVPTYLTSRGTRYASGVARLKPGVTVEQAQQQLNGITAALAQEFPDTNDGLGAEAALVKDYWFGKLRDGLILVTILAGILLLIACINVASLLLARALALQRAWTIRVALGASRARLVRQLLTESLLLSLIGAVAGLLLAQWATRALIAMSGTELPSFVDMAAAPEVIVAVVAIALICGVAFGLVPVWISFRMDLARTLGRDEKVPPAGRGWQRFQSAVVVAQVALALTLSISAVLMAKGYNARLSEDLGFKPDNVMTFRMDIRDPKYFNDALAAQMLRETYLPRISAVPGVEKVAMANPTIPTDDWSGVFLTIEDRDSDSPDGTFTGVVHSVTPAYFDVLSIPILQGRAFNAQDFQTNAVIVSKTMADLHWPNQNPIGKRLKLGMRSSDKVDWLNVVGVAAPARHEGFKDEKPPAPELYLSLLQFPRRPLTVNYLVIPKAGVPVEQVQASLQEEIRAINPEVPAYEMMPLQDLLDKQTGRARFLVILMSLFAALALIMASIGIYGVISYSVTQRSREIAIRMSLGASRGQVLGMMVGRGAVLAGIGLVLGLVTLFALSRLIVNLLYETSVTDPLILGGTSLALLLVTLLANYL